MPTGLWLGSYLALWAVLIAATLALVAVIRQVRELHSYWVSNDPAWGLPEGVLAPALPGEDVYGRPVVLGAARGRKTILMFLSRGCKTCKQAMSAMPVLGRREDVDLVLIVRARPLETKLFVAGFKREAYFAHLPVLADPEGALSEQYRAHAVPYNVVIDEDGRVGARTAGRLLDEIEGLLRQTEELRQRRLAGELGADLAAGLTQAGAAASGRPAA